MSQVVMATEVALSAAVPATGGSVPSIVNQQSNYVHTPLPPGQITVAQSPSGVPVTNTGRTNHAHGSYMLQLNANNIGKNPPLNPYVPPR